MIKQKRFDKIMEIINEQNAASIEELCDRIGVSKATIRRDLIYLDEHKLLKRTHGGAVSLVKSAIEDVPITLRHHMYRTEKERIASAALRLVEDGQTVYIGTGSTMQELAKQMAEKSQLTVLTNDIGVAYEISQQPANRLIVSGGKLETATASLTGSIAEWLLRKFRVDVAFMSADAVTPDGFADLNIDEASIKRLMIHNAKKKIMLCDQSKFTTEAFVTVCPLSDVTLTITNGDLSPEAEKLLLDAGIELHIV